VQRLLLVIGLLGACLAPAAPAQPAPRGERLLEAWRASTRQVFDDVDEMAWTERADLAVEGPGGTDRLRTVTAVRGGTDAGMNRDLQRAEWNGRPVPAGRLAFLERRMRRAYGPGFEWVRRPLPPEARLFAAFRAEGNARPDQLDGTPAWVVEVVPARERDRFEGGTLWFSRERGDVRLLRSRLVGRIPRGRSAVVTTDYVSVEGLDVPRRVRAEAVVQQRRRLRVFTVLLTLDATLEGHRVRR